MYMKILTLIPLVIFQMEIQYMTIPYTLLNFMGEMINFQHTQKYKKKILLTVLKKTT